jgi:hypothetical protein
MTNRVQIVGHDTSGANAFTGRQREVTVDYSRNDLRVHDGVIAGGHRIKNAAQVDADVAAQSAIDQAYTDTEVATRIANSIATAAHSMLISDGANSWVEFAVPTSSIVGRKASGAIEALDESEFKTLFSVQTVNALLNDISGITFSSDDFIKYDGANLVNRTPAEVRTDLEIDTSANGYKYTFATNTKMLFQQSAAPIGWTLDTSSHDKVLRVINTGTVGTGGSWTISGVTVDGHALTGSELPAEAVLDLVLLETYTNVDNAFNSLLASASYGYPKMANIGTPASAGGDATHDHGITADGNWRPAYVDVIVASKDAP